MNADDAETGHARLQEMLSTHPLHKKVVLTNIGTDIPLPTSFKAACGICKDPSSVFVAVDKKKCYIAYSTLPQYVPTNVTYQCSLCGKFQRHLMIAASPMKPPVMMQPLGMTYPEIWVSKAGQLPPFDVTPPAGLEKYVESADVKFYRNGLHCISRSLGVGAIAYFRRVVEDVTNQILTLIEDAAKEDGDSEVLKNIEEARKKFTADDRLRIAANKLPKTLDLGQNALKILYGVFSEKLHGASEDDCLEYAMKLDKALAYFLTQAKKSIDAQREFKQALQKAGVV